MPRFHAITRLKNDVTSISRGGSITTVRIHHFSSWSSTMTRAASDRPSRRMAVAEGSERRGGSGQRADDVIAAPAQPGLVSRAGDLRQDSPAALALAPLGEPDDDADLGHVRQGEG